MKPRPPWMAPPPPPPEESSTVKYLIVIGLKLVAAIAGLVFLGTPRGSDHLALFVVSLGVVMACLALIYLLDGESSRF